MTTAVGHQIQESTREMGSRGMHVKSNWSYSHLFIYFSLRQSEAEG